MESDDDVYEVVMIDGYEDEGDQEMTLENDPINPEEEYSLEKEPFVNHLAIEGYSDDEEPLQYSTEATHEEEPLQYNPATPEEEPFDYSPATPEKEPFEYSPATPEEESPEDNPTTPDEEPPDEDNPATPEEEPPEDHPPATPEEDYYVVYEHWVEVFDEDGDLYGVLEEDVPLDEPALFDDEEEVPELYDGAALDDEDPGEVVDPDDDPFPYWLIDPHVPHDEGEMGETICPRYRHCWRRVY